MDMHSQLSNAVLQAASFLPTVPADLALSLRSLKARAEQEPSREPEDELAAALAGEMGPYMQRVAEQIVNGQQPDTDDMDAAILILLLLSLMGSAAANAMQRGAALGVELSVDAINRRAAQWAQSYTYDMVRGINETTRQAISRAVQQYANTPGMSVDDVAKMLEPTFGPARARMIAATETTRAYSQSAQITGDELRQQGVVTAQQWVTWRDDRVCPICAPLHNRFDWQAGFPYGPPAHVSCRCWLAVVRV